MAKVKRMKGKGTYIFFKELGGAPERTEISKTASVLLNQNLINGRTLDYGCGQGFDADQLNWESFDPYYRPNLPEGKFDTIVVNHVLNILTKNSRQSLYKKVDDLLDQHGKVYFSVARNIPKEGKHGPRKRLQNYIILDLQVVYEDDIEAIYVWEKGAAIDDLTKEFEDQF